MANEKTYELSILIKDKQAVLELNEFNPGNGANENFKEDVLQVEARFAEMFYKLINFIRFENNMFKKEDYIFLGEVLGKIIFSGEWAIRMLEHIFRNLDKLERLRIYLEFHPDSKMAMLPWEYVQVWPPGKFKALSEKSIYLSANENSRFHLIRRLSKDVDPPPASPMINVVLVICNGRNPDEDITALDQTQIERVFEDLQKNNAATFNYKILDNPADDGFVTSLITAIMDFPREGNTIPPFIIHYFGHSKVKDNHGYLVFKTKTLDATWIKDEDFAGYIDRTFIQLKCNEGNANENELIVDVPSVVLFQSCQSGRVGDFASGKGVAIAACRKKIPAVIGMQNEIDPTSSSEFCRVFYESLLKGKDIAEAVTNGRFFLGCKYKIKTSSDVFGRNEFGSPVLFINTKEPFSLLPDEKKKEKSDEKNKLSINLCPNCSAENETDALYCKKCGKLLVLQKFHVPSAQEAADTNYGSDTQNLAFESLAGSASTAKSEANKAGMHEQSSGKTDKPGSRQSSPRLKRERDDS